MSAQNDNGNNNSNPFSGKSLSSRFGRANASQSNNNNNNNQQQNNNNSNSNSSSGGRFGSGSNRFRSSSNPFNQNQNLSWGLTPIHKTAVRFELKGLGDPFYRMLGHDLNTEYGQSRKVARALEAGGEHVEAIMAMLDEAWKGYDLTGAALVYTWNPKPWNIIVTPSPMPAPPQPESKDDSDDDEEDKKPDPIRMFNVVRALDMKLTLNVLARSRSQLMMAEAPLVMSTEYLNRSIITDDPQLVALAQATGCLEEALA